MEFGRPLFGIVLLSLFVLLALVAVVGADIAPESHITLYVTYNGAPITGTFYATLLYCVNSTSVDTTGILVPQLNVTEYDPLMGCYWQYDRYAWGGMCGGGMCNFTYEFVQDTFRAAFYLPALNKTFVSQDVSNSNFTGSYGVQLYPNDSVVFTNSNPIIPPDVLYPFLFALAFTVVIELIAAYVYLLIVKIKKKRRILLTVILANFISVPIVWFGFVFVIGGWAGLLLGELFAVIFEGCAIYYLNKKTIKLNSALLMSLAMNLTSLIIGGLILYGVV